MACREPCLLTHCGLVMPYGGITMGQHWLRSDQCWLITSLSSTWSSRQPPTVGTPYNMAPYITGSNIARLGHGSQNSWSKLWIPIVKSVPVRVIFTWNSVPKKSIHGSSNIYLNTMEAEARLPVVLPFRCHCHLPLIWHNRHYMTPWSSIHGQEGLIDANCICLRFTGTWAHRHRHPVDSCLQARWTRSMLPK